MSADGIIATKRTEYTPLTREAFTEWLRKEVWGKPYDRVAVEPVEGYELSDGTIELRDATGRVLMQVSPTAWRELSEPLKFG